MSSNHPELVEQIANAFINGLHHPGDRDNNQQATTLNLPMFRSVGAPPELVRQVELTVKLIAESIVHLIENDGGYDLVRRVNTPPTEEEKAS